MPAKGSMPLTKEASQVRGHDKYAYLIERDSRVIDRIYIIECRYCYYKSKVTEINDKLVRTTCGYL